MNRVPTNIRKDGEPRPDEYRQPNAPPPCRDRGWLGRVVIDSGRRATQASPPTPSSTPAPTDLVWLFLFIFIILFRCIFTFPRHRLFFI